MEIIGFILGIFIGISLGLIGSGGSILAIPTLVYLMLIPPSIATTYSLFIVGLSALIGSINGIRNGLLDYKVALFFGLPSVISIFIMRMWLVPLLPEIFFTINGFVVSKDLFIMIVFSLLMITASFSMIKKQKLSISSSKSVQKLNLGIMGTIVGALTGFVGVGGGFLIIPTLVFSAKLTMQKAVATSLTIVAFNSLIGFAGSMNQHPIDWKFLLSFTGFAVAGIFVGMYLNKKISNEKLKPAFGWFVLATGIYIIIKEFT